ncbi:MAG: orotate phosphoribosyltransferase [Pelagibacterales bacterium MED-G40]|nr:MAG: orotate phosphoribosyltransferase [Pelagibacterales bacterium MED-G40]|tara:strand:- start:19550 stop:20131 length:582 start_codon:yes stop_codon:yes gene_type:complete
MLSYKESLEILKESKALLDGHFILSSGLHSSQYIQCAQLLSKPYLSKKICSSLAEKINNEFKEIDLILSPAIGGIVIGYEMGKLLNKETIFAERINNNFTLRRDFKIPSSSKVLIVEDVITTGKSSLECVEIIKKSEAKTIGFACLIDRSQGKSVIKSKIVSQIEINIPTYDKKNLPETLLSIKAVKPGSRGL